jgi:hypothetical protein
MISTASSSHTEIHEIFSTEITVILEVKFTITGQLNNSRLIENNKSIRNRKVPDKLIIDLIVNEFPVP